MQLQFCYPNVTQKKKRQIALEFMSYKSLFLLCTPERIRTSNRLIRSQVLYPVELRVHI